MSELAYPRVSEAQLETMQREGAPIREFMLAKDLRDARRIIADRDAAIKRVLVHPVMNPAPYETIPGTPQEAWDYMRGHILKALEGGENAG
jgi:hypothetical protein